MIRLFATTALAGSLALSGVAPAFAQYDRDHDHGPPQRGQYEAPRGHWEGDRGRGDERGRGHYEAPRGHYEAERGRGDDRGHGGDGAAILGGALLGLGVGALLGGAMAPPPAYSPPPAYVPPPGVYYPPPPPAYYAPPPPATYGY